MECCSTASSSSSSKNKNSNKKGKTIKNEGEGEGEGDHQWRWWAELGHDILSAIFVRVVPADTLLRSVPFVCKGWRDVVAGPHCWADVDLEHWARRVSSTPAVDFAVAHLARRAAGTLRRLSTYKLGNHGFSFAATSTKFLKVLQITMSEVTDQTVKKHIGSLQHLTVLDISYCLGITHKGIEMIGQNCNSLIELRRNMPPPQPEVTHQDNGIGTKIDELEALAVASTMHGLEQLELAYGRFSDAGLNAIVENCVGLKILDIRGCWNVRLEGSLESKCDLIQSFRDPWHDEYDYDDATGDEGDNMDYDDDDGGGGGEGGGGGGGGVGGGGVEVVVISDDDDGDDDSDGSW